MQQIKKKNKIELPAIRKSLSEEKIFKNNQILTETKKVFLSRFSQDLLSENIDDNPDNEDENKPKLKNRNRSLIQFPSVQLKDKAFVSFKSINKQQGKNLINCFKQMRSKSTMLQPLVKAEIISNEREYHKIQSFCQKTLEDERRKILEKIQQMTPYKMKKQIKVKDKNKYTTKKLNFITLTLNYQIYDHNLHCHKPFVDYDAMAMPINGKVYFIGGRKDGVIIVYDPKYDQWQSLKEIEKLKPFGECRGSLISTNEILFFGGLQFFKLGFSLMSNSIKILNVEKMSVEFRSFSEEKAPLRAFHAQCTYGKFIIISGGVDNSNKLFNNFMNYNYEKNYWCELTVYSLPQLLKGGFAKHRMLPIFHQRKNYSIYDEEPIMQKYDYIKEQGIYMFGGEDGNAELIDKLFIMRLGSPSIVVQEPLTIGKGPVARKNMEMIHHKEYIIIHGGRNDEMKPFVLNSMHFLHLRTLNWIEVKGEKPPYRYSHALLIHQSDILILGGKNTEGLCKQRHINMAEITPEN